MAFEVSAAGALPLTITTSAADMNSKAVRRRSFSARLRSIFPPGEIGASGPYYSDLPNRQTNVSQRPDQIKDSSAHFFEAWNALDLTDRIEGVPMATCTLTCQRFFLYFVRLWY